MSRLIVSRRKLLGLGAASATSLALSGCSQFDFLGRRDDPIRAAIAGANDFTYAVQRALLGDQTLAPEYSESEIRQGMRANGSVDPARTNPEYRALLEGGFADYRLRVTGLVDRQGSYTLDELRNMPSRTQITRHDCVEGWSCIAKWSGTPLGPILDAAGVRPGARFVVFHCYDLLGGGLSRPVAYYTSCDLIDAYHAQTIVAYGVNDATLPVANGAPVRVRIERTLGYKQPKYVHTIEVADSFSDIGRGKGGYWEDNGYDWYGGI